MKLNCLNLDVDTCQLSSFSVARPPEAELNRQRRFCLKRLALTPQKSFLPVPALPTGVDCLWLQAHYLTAKGKLVQHPPITLIIYLCSSLFQVFPDKWR